MPDALKVNCLRTFSVCDVFWIGLMVKYRARFKWTHRLGSYVTIGLRTPFLLRSEWMFA